MALQSAQAWLKAFAIADTVNTSCWNQSILGRPKGTAWVGFLERWCWVKKRGTVGGLETGCWRRAKALPSLGGVSANKTPRASVLAVELPGSSPSSDRIDHQTKSHDATNSLLECRNTQGGLVP